MSNGRNYILSKTGKISIDKLQYYISELKVNGKHEPGVWLINAFGDHTIILRNNEKIRQLSFLIGTTESVNLEGVHTGALDPVYGMYWTWNSGFVNFKIEGYADSSSNSIKKYEYHVGGYKPGEETARFVNFKVKRKKAVNIIFAADEFLQLMDLRQQPIISAPGAAAVSASKKYASLFRLKK